MIPLRDNIPSRRFPFMNVALIGLNTLFFFYELSLGDGLDEVLVLWGVVPLRLALVLGGQQPVEALGTLVSSQFLHAGWGHFLGNMLFLWIFGDNVEDALGSLRYLAFYLISGVGAGIAQVVVAPLSPVPMIGASGAISGVLGAYLILYPRASVSVLLLWVFFFTVVQIPAVLLLGLWFFTQFINGMATLPYASMVSGGVAWWSHISGFLLGIVLLWFFRRPRRRL